MQIQEVCNKTGLTKRTIRFYIEKELLSPKIIIRNDKEYREYSEKDIQALICVSNLRKLRFTLNDIKAMQLSSRNIKNILMRHLEAISEDISNQQVIMNELQKIQRESFNTIEDLSYRLKTISLLMQLPQTDIEPESILDKFTGKSSAYKQFRPSYPKQYIDYITKNAFLNSHSSIADIGSGTGILTKELLELGYSVIAVEPNADMRNQAEMELGMMQNFLSINATAEHTTLQANSIDLVTVAQAFHWFDKAMFQLECRRILKKTGLVALVWNSRDYNSVVVRENSNICMKYCPKFKGFSGGIDNQINVFDHFFNNGEYEYRLFQNPLKYDLNTFIGRNLSGSYAPTQTDEQYSDFIMAITELFYKYSKNDILTLPNITRSYLGKV
jgi:DNA-binding transcriptional MerR regulator/ubiquinone/menaquinone biosynthesis C-methylase UbiE